MTLLANSRMGRIIFRGLRGATGPKGDPGSGGNTYSTIVSLATAGSTATNLDGATLTQAGRSGRFIYTSASIASGVTSDPMQGIYIAKASDSTGASGGWVRSWDFITGYPEWFGAITGPGQDTVTQIEMALSLCPKVAMKRDDYYVSRTLVVNVKGRELYGTEGGYVYNRFEGTRIVAAFATGDIVRIGPATDPGGNPGVTYLAGVRCHDFTVYRTVACVPNATLDQSPCGVRVNWVYYNEMYNIGSMESSIGFLMYGNVGCIQHDCTAYKNRNSTTLVNDCFIGFYFKGDPPVFTGGNASIVNRECKSSCQMVGAVPTMIGFYLPGSFADVYLDRPETVLGNAGIYAGTLGAGGGDAANVNLHINNPVIDQPYQYGIVFQNTAPGSQVELTGTYGGNAGTSLAALLFDTFRGSITATGMIAASAGAADPIGVYIKSSNGISLRGLQIQNFERPIAIETSTDYDIDVYINNPTVTATQAAISISDSTMGSVRASMKGKNNAFPVGMQCVGGNVHLTEFNLTRINAAAISGGAANKLKINSVSITAPGYYNANGTNTGSPNDIDVRGIMG